MQNPVFSIIALCCGWVIPHIVSAQVLSCGLTEVAQHRDSDRTRIYSAESELAALYFKADMDVNTDGAAKSYHPDDPRGNQLALNNMGNAISRIFDATGKDITCSPRSGDCYSLFINTFEQARDANYNPVGFARVETTDMIPWRDNDELGWQVPCTIESGPNAGYFVSQTSVVVDASKQECDAERYLDSLSINANVLPKNIQWASQGVRTDRTDLVVARDMETGVIAYGVNGDRGPADKIGEGSIAFTAALSSVTLSNEATYAKIRSLARQNVEYLIFPSRDIRRLAGNGFTQEEIDRYGAEAFSEWGGSARLDACKSLK
jgi:hypothetical protein